MGLEESPTAYGVPLSSMAKSSPPPVLVKLQESSHGGKVTPVGFLTKDPQNPPQVWAPHPTPPKSGLYGIHSPPTRLQMLSHALNLQENQNLVTHHGTRPLYTVVVNLHHRM